MPKFIKKFKIDQIEGLIAIIVITSLITFGVLQCIQRFFPERTDNLQHQSAEHEQPDNRGVHTNQKSTVERESGEVAIE